MASSLKDMAMNFQKLAKFEGVGFRRWQKKMHFLLTTLNVVYVLATPRPPLPQAGEEEPLETVRRRAKWDSDDYVCRGHILNALSDSLFDLYQNAENAKALWDSLEAKYISEDASSKKFLVSNFNLFKMTNDRPIMEQFHEIHHILNQIQAHGMVMDEAIAVASIIDKLPPSWRETKNALKHKKEDMTMEQLGTHLRIEEGIRAQDGVKDTNNNVQKSAINVVEVGESSGTKKSNVNTKTNVANKKRKALACWVCNGPHLKRDCPSKKKKAKKDQPKGGPSNQGMHTHVVTNDEMNFVAMISEICVVQVDDTWWIDSGASRHVCKDRHFFKTYKELEDGPILYMGNDSTVKARGIGQVELLLTSGKTLTLRDVVFVPEVRKNLVSGGLLNKFGFRMVFESDKFVLSKGGIYVGQGYYCNGMFKLNIDNKIVDSVYMLDVSSLWHNRLCHVNNRRLYDMSKMGLIPPFDLNLEKCKTCMLNKITRTPFPSVTRQTVLLELVHSDLCDLHSSPSLGNKKYVVTFIDDASRFCYLYLLSSKDEALDKFKIYKTEVELQLDLKIKKLRTDRGGEYFDPSYFKSIGIIHETTPPYTPQSNGVAERKNRTLKEMVNSMLSNSGLSDGFWGEAMLTTCYVLNRVPNKRNKITPYELWSKRKPNLHYFRVWGCRAIVKLTEPKRKTLGERGIDCVFIGYAENSKAYRFYVLEHNDFVSIHSVIESRDAIFDETRFSSIPRPKDMVPSTSTSIVDDITNDHDTTIPEVRKSKRIRKAKSFGPDFQLYLVEGSRESLETQASYCYHMEEDPKSFDEAMKSHDAAFWKEAVNDEMDSILGNNTWVLSDLPPGCKPLGCKWIFVTKRRVDGTILKHKARLVAQGFRQKYGIDYFDTYAPVARIATIRLLIALSAIHGLEIHQMDVKTAFLNGELEEEVYMNQPEGFKVKGQEMKVCKLVRSLYGLKQAPKQWHQKFDDVVLANGFKINQSDKCVYSKFDDSGKGVIICLYVDDMLIFGTDLDEVIKTKVFLSSSFSMKDLGQADVILGIRIVRGEGTISLSQSHYIEKVIQKFNDSNSSHFATPMDPSVKLVPSSVLQLHNWSMQAWLEA